MSSTEKIAAPAYEYLQGWEAALRELRHQAIHLEDRGAHRGATTLYDAIRIARAGGLACREHKTT
jgi:hypothetical protein